MPHLLLCTTGYALWITGAMVQICVLGGNPPRVEKLPGNGQCGMQREPSRDQFPVAEELVQAGGGLPLVRLVQTTYVLHQMN